MFIFSGKSIEELSETTRSRRFLFKLYLLSSVDRIFYPLIAIPLYGTVGPWFVGYVLDDHIGVCFVWGMIIEGSYLPGGITYIMGAILVNLVKQGFEEGYTPHRGKYLYEAP